MPQMAGLGGASGLGRRRTFLSAPQPTIIDLTVFRGRFTADEMAAIMRSSLSAIPVNANGRVDLKAGATVSWAGSLADMGILSRARASVILVP